MKTQRYKTGRDLPFQEVYPLRVDGKCRNCQATVPKARTNWCSDSCQNYAFSEVMFLRGSSAYIREKVFGRDDGICASCGVDCKRLQKISDSAYWSLYDHADDKITLEDLRYRQDENGKFYSPAERFRKDYFKFARKLCKDTPLNFGSTCWHADHIVEVVNGGSHTMENLQTLCVSCHKAKTKKLIKISSLKLNT